MQKDYKPTFVKLIICHHCNCAFTPINSDKKCDCGLTTGIIINGVVNYSGSDCSVVDISSDISNIISHYSDSFAIKKDGKLLKKEVNDTDRIFCIKTIEYLNAKAGTDFSTKFPSSNSALILSRRDELKCSLADIFRVIDNKVIEWKGTQMEAYLRPKTLFNKTNFINYLGQNAIRQKQATGKSFDQFADAANAAKSNLLDRSGQVKE